jgi:hypothetical protein
MQAAELKERLGAIAEAEFTLPEGEDVNQIIEACLAHLGSTDPELRDELIYLVLARWSTRGVLGEDEKKQLLWRLLDEDHLRYGLGQDEDDSVFMRSFSVLSIPPILYAHRQEPFLSRQEILKVNAAVLAYLGAERDRRGYVHGKGWAHAIAHSADTVDEIALCREVGVEQLREMLEVLFKVITTDGAVYAYDEDERLTTAVVTIWERGLLSIEELQAWLKRLVQAAQEREPFPEAYFREINVKHFLRSLYHRARKREGGHELTGAVEEVVDNVGRFR